jgi:hypothetical protein
MEPGPHLSDIEAALATVQRTLDRLTTLGRDEAAFAVARAQFSASIRSSWPGNLSTLVTSLEGVASDPTSGLSGAERADLALAIDTLRRVRHP